MQRKQQAAVLPLGGASRGRQFTSPARPAARSSGGGGARNALLPAFLAVVVLASLQSTLLPGRLLSFGGRSGGGDDAGVGAHDAGAAVAAPLAQWPAGAGDSASLLQPDAPQPAAAAVAAPPEWDGFAAAAAEEGGARALDAAGDDAAPAVDDDRLASQSQSPSPGSQAAPAPAAGAGDGNGATTTSNSGGGGGGLLGSLLGGLGGARRRKIAVAPAAAAADAGDDDAVAPDAAAPPLPSLAELLAAGQPPAAAAAGDDDDADGGGSPSLGLAMACDAWSGEHTFPAHATYAAALRAASGGNGASDDNDDDGYDYVAREGGADEPDDGDDPAVSGGLPFLRSGWVLEQLAAVRAAEGAYAREAALQRDTLCARQKRRLAALRAGDGFGAGATVRVPVPQPLNALSHAADLYAGPDRAPAAHDITYAWPLPYALPLPSVVQAGCDPAGTTDGARLPCVDRRDVLAHISAPYETAVGNSTNVGGGASLWARLGLHPADALSRDMCVHEGGGGSGSGSGDGATAGAAASAAAPGGAGAQQLHLPRRLLFGLSRRTLAAVTLPEVRFLRRALARGCRTLARHNRARALQTVGALGEYLGSYAGGGGCSAAAPGVLAVGRCPTYAESLTRAPVPVFRAEGDEAGKASSGGDDTTGGQEPTVGSLRRRLARFEASVWGSGAASSSSSKGSSTGAAAAAADAGLSLVLLDVRGSDATAVGRMRARAAAVAADAAYTPLSLVDAYVAVASGAAGGAGGVGGLAPPNASVAALTAGGLVGEWTADALAAALPHHVRPGRWEGHALLREKLAAVRSQRRALGAAVGAYVDVLLPHDAADEGYELRLARGLATTTATAGVRAVITAPSIWGAIHGLTTLAGVADGVALHARQFPSPVDHLLRAVRAMTATAVGDADDAAAEARHEATHAFLQQQAGPSGDHRLASAALRAATALCPSCALAGLQTLLTQAEAEAAAAAALRAQAAASGYSSAPDAAARAALVSVRWSALGTLDATAGSPTATLASLPLVVVDRPWRKWRGFLQDSARHWLPPAALRRTVDAAAASKMSVYHWHLVDSQAWPVQLASFPELAAAGSWHPTSMTYGRADLAGVVRYAADRGLRVVAEFDTPSHTRALTGAAVWRLGRRPPKLWRNLVRAAAAAAGTADGGVKLASVGHLMASLASTYRELARVEQEGGDGHGHGGGGKAMVAAAGAAAAAADATAFVPPTTPRRRRPPPRLVPIASACDHHTECGSNRSYAGKGGDVARVTAFPSWESDIDVALGDLDTSQCLRTHNAGVLDPTRDETIVSMAAIYAELADVFPDGSMHVGADEVLNQCYNHVHHGDDDDSGGGTGSGAAGGHDHSVSDVDSDSEDEEGDDEGQGKGEGATDAAAADSSDPVMAASQQALRGAQSTLRGALQALQRRVLPAMGVVAEHGHGGVATDDDKVVLAFARARLPHLLLPPALRCLAQADPPRAAVATGAYTAALPASPVRAEFSDAYAAATAHVMRRAVTVVSGVLGRGAVTWSDAALDLAAEWANVGSRGVGNAEATCEKAAEKAQEAAAAPAPKPATSQPHHYPFLDGDVAARRHVSLAGYGSPRTVVLQSWRCWTMRFEHDLITAAAADVGGWDADSAAEVADVAAGRAFPGLHAGSYARAFAGMAAGATAGNATRLLGAAHRFTGPSSLRGLLQSACWYLDDNANTWQAMASHWVLPSFAQTMRAYAELLCEAERSASDGRRWDAFDAAHGLTPGLSRAAAARLPAACAHRVAPDPPSLEVDALAAVPPLLRYAPTPAGDPSLSLELDLTWPPALHSAGPFMGGEASAWAEEIDDGNLHCRAWPRAAVAGEGFWSESAAYDRYARGLAATGAAAPPLAPYLLFPSAALVARANASAAAPATADAGDVADAAATLAAVHAAGAALAGGGLPKTPLAWTPGQQRALGHALPQQEGGGNPAPEELASPWAAHAQARRAQLRAYGQFEWARRSEHEGSQASYYPATAHRLLAFSRRLWAGGVPAEPTAPYHAGDAHKWAAKLYASARVAGRFADVPAAALAPPAFIGVHTGQHEAARYDGFCPGYFATPRHRRVDGPPAPGSGTSGEAEVANKLVVWPLSIATGAGAAGVGNLLGGGRDQHTWLRDSGADVAVLFHHVADDLASGSLEAVARSKAEVAKAATSSITSLEDEPPRAHEFVAAPWQTADLQTQRLRFVGGRNSFPYAYAMPGHHDTAIYLLSRHPAAVLGASTSAVSHGLLVADVGGVRYVAASLGAVKAKAKDGGSDAGYDAPSDEVAALLAVVREAAAAALPLVVTGRCAPHALTPEAAAAVAERCAAAAAAAKAAAARKGRNATARAAPPPPPLLRPDPASFCHNNAVGALTRAGLLAMPTLDTQPGALEGDGLAHGAEGCDGDGEHGHAAHHGPVFVLVNAAFAEAVAPGTPFCTRRHGVARYSASQHPHDHDPVLCRWRHAQPAPAAAAVGAAGDGGGSASAKVRVAKPAAAGGSGGL